MSYRFVDSFRAAAARSNLYDIRVYITECTVTNSWWWTEELSETCRVSFQNKFEKLVHLVGFIISEFMHSFHFAKCVSKRLIRKKKETFFFSFVPMVAKTPIAFAMSVHLSLCPSLCLSASNSAAPTGYFPCNLVLWDFCNNVKKIQIWLKWDKHVGQFGWRPKYVSRS
jgi:hypothetical protein